ncbi:MAG: hypothetical protein KF747_08485 [Nitrospira sp.]|nr:hypothetical protein [Nitrospira sp.]
MIDVPKTATLSLLLVLAVLIPWQATEAAHSVRGRHSLIHRPQIQPASAAPAPQLQSSSPVQSTSSQSVQRKVVKRPAAPASPVAEVSPVDLTNSAQIDFPPPPQSYNPDNAPPEAEMLPPPEPQESANTDAP